MPLQLKNIKKDYIAEGGKVVNALHNINLTVEDNSFISLIGPSGCGKSTMLHIAAGLIQATEGEVIVNGLSPQQAQEKGEIGLIFQEASLLPWRTVRENIQLASEIRAIKKSKTKFRDVEELIQLMELEGFADHFPRELSGGMSQRVAIARSLYYDPDILFMDEPFGALDELTRHRMNIELLNIWEKSKKTVLFVTHNIEEAVFLSDRVLVMSSRPGRIVKDLIIDLERPRKAEMKRTTRFLEFQNVLRKSLESDLTSKEAE